MANDKLMTYDQGESIKTKLTDIANNISNINKNIELPSSKITTMQNYMKGSSTASISPSDSLNQAVAKLENRTDVNENNILLSEEMNGAKNLCKLRDSISSSNSSYTVTVQSDKSIVVNKTATTSSASSVDLTESITVDTSKQYVLVGNPNTVNDITLLIAYATTPFSWIGEQINDTPLVFTPTSNTVKISIYFRATSSTKTVTIKPMLIEKAVYDAGFTDYQPYSLPNTVITPALQSLLDESKNLADFKNAPKAVSQNSTSVKTDTAVTVTSNGTWGHSAWNVAILEKGDYILVCDVTNYAAESATCRVGIGASNTNTVSVTGNGKVIFPFTWATDAKVNVYVYANFSANTYANSLTVSNVMICKADEYNASSNYAKYRNPFAPSKQVGEVDLNDLVAEGEYFAGQLTTAHHAPETGYYFVKVMALALNASDLIQIGFRLNMPEKIYVRHRTYKSTDPYYEWSSWFLFTGTVVS